MININWQARRAKALEATPGNFQILGSNKKITKGEKKGILTVGISLSPATESVEYGGVNACAFSTEGCRNACLKFAGLNRMPQAKAKRIELFLWFLNDRKTFLERLDIEVEAFIRKAEKKDMIPAVRTNVLQDIRILGKHVADKFGDRVRVYDYTKIPVPSKKIESYTLTFSRSESNWGECIRALSLGYQVAVVFDVDDPSKLPTSYEGYAVVNGDESDARFILGGAEIVGLTLKGSNAAKQAARESGFAVKVGA